MSVSAKSEDSLRNYIRASHDFLSSNNNTNISDYCYSANIGRTQFEFRKAFVSDDLGGMVEKLSEYLSEDNITPNSEVSVNSNELKTIIEIG